MTAHSTLDRWRAEKSAAWLAREVAAVEPDAKPRALFESMARAAEEQAAILAQHIGQLPSFHPSLRTMLVARITRLIGPRAARPLLAAMKVRGLSVYAGSGIAAGHVMPTAVAQIGGRHRGAGGGALRAAVFGVNDGLLSNTSLVLGIAGAAADAKTIVVTGVAGLLAGAFSMAAGEYVSMRSQRELFEYQIAEERDELETYPDEEAEELALIYEARGMTLEDARVLVRQLMKNPDVALDLLAREELGLNPNDLGSPWAAAFWSFTAFAGGALVPLVPFFVGLKQNAVMASALAAIIVLFGIGAALSLFSGRNALLGGARMIFIGMIAGSATFAIGRLFGVAMS